MQSNGINIYVNFMLPKYEGFIMHEGPSQNIVLYNFANLLEDISSHSHSQMKTLQKNEK